MVIGQINQENIGEDGILDWNTRGNRLVTHMNVIEI